MLGNDEKLVGATRGELRHSNFLAYLLSPSRPHGLGARPPLAILRSILKGMPEKERPISALELLTKDMDDAIVYRERHNVDILIELPSMKFIVAIENKVGSKVGEGQLKGYDEFLIEIYPKHRRLMVFLTPDATEPDHPGYVAYDYGRVASTLEMLIAEPFEVIPNQTLLIIQHYIAMVRRHIVQDEKLRGLALALYERHKEAFDFIFDCRPEAASLLNVARQCVEAVDGLAVDSNGANSVRFFPSIWDKQLKYIKGDPLEWTKTGRGLLFELKTYPKIPGRVSLALVLGPGQANMRCRRPRRRSAGRSR